MTSPFIRRMMWDLVMLAAIGGIIYGSIEYIAYAGPWKALVIVPLLMVSGWLAVSMLYPLWYRD
jgi:hypothetical protein